MIGLHGGRVLAVLFLELESAGRLGGPFPFYAGWGDIVTGALALPLAFAVRREESVRGALLALVFAWNLFGAGDLLLAIFLGVTSAEGSPLQMFFAAPGSEAAQHPPFSLVPTVLVPFYLILHALVFMKVASAMGASRQSAH